MKGGLEMSRLIDADVLEPDADYDDGEYWAVSIAQIQNAPTIEERKTGEWIDANDGKWNTIEVLKCSVCGEIDNRMYRTDNFCPACGAMMEGEQA